MIKLALYPQLNDDLRVSYSASGNVLNVTINGESDAFEFVNIEDGILNEFVSESLPVMPVMRAEVSNGTIAITAIQFIPSRPMRDEEESDEAYQTRLDAWIASQEIKEVTL